MSDNISILFVDDEPNVLASIKRTLRSKRDEWKMSFAESGVEALAMFDDIEFDVIISDIRMPGMDGTELLNKVRDRHPGVVRIALSGQVDINDVMLSIQTAHQYISKPCEAEDLIKRVEGAVKSREILTDPKMQQLAAEINTLPVIPKIFHSIEDELRLKEPSIEKIALLITEDVGLVAKILKLVNSPYFGLPSDVNSIFQAIKMLGLETIEALILSTHLFSMYDEHKLSSFSFNMLWEHSSRVSNIARLIAQCEELDKKVLIQARMAGLLHDIGKLVLVSSFPGRYQMVLDKIAAENLTIHDSEMEIFGTTHAHMGAYLMGLWGIPGEVVHGIGYHHCHEKFDLSIPMLVSVANAIDHHCVTIQPNNVKIGINGKLLPKDRRVELLEKWINYVKEHWKGVDEFQVINANQLAKFKI